VQPLASRRSDFLERLPALQEPLSVFLGHRGESFVVVQPLASGRSDFLERLPALQEPLSVFLGHRDESFDVVQPLASGRSDFLERLPALQEPRLVFREQHCKLYVCTFELLLPIREILLSIRMRFL
jgi:hypothetical protein